MFGTEFAVEAYRLLMEVLGANAQVRSGSAGEVLAGRIERAHRAALILTFGGGTNEVQRDIIAAAGLGLPALRRNLMDFTFSEAQDELAGLAGKILAERDAPWPDLAAAGVLAAGLPEALGGAGLGLLEQCSVLAEIGRAVSDVPYLASIVLGAGAIAEFGRRSNSSGGRSRPGVARSCSPPRWRRRTATTRGHLRPPRCGRHGRWLLSGVKTAVPAAPRADLLLVPASAAGRGAGVPGRAVRCGVSVQPQQLTDFAEAGRVVLDGVTLDDDRVLPGQGAEVADWLVSRGTVGLCALQAGVLERALELTAEYARNRVQFGRPIGSFQAVAQRLADAYIDAEAVRLTMWQAAWLLAGGRRLGSHRGRHGQVLGRRRRPPGGAHRGPRARRVGHRHVLPGAPLLRRGQAPRVRPRRRHRPAPPHRRDPENPRW